MHNVLKRIRMLSNNSADRLLEALGLTLEDLLWRAAAEPDAGIQAIPVVRNRIVPGTDAVLTITRGFIPMPRSIARNLVEPVAARVGPDLVLPGAVAAHDMVLLDQNPRLRSVPAGKNLWVVREEGGLRIRYVRMGGTRLYIANQATIEDPQKWQSVPLKGRSILEVVLARVVWIGRELDALSPHDDDDPAAQLFVPSSS
jgi:hypothetical protein